MNIANIKIGHRLTLAFSLTTLLLAAVVATGAIGLGQTSAEIDLTVNDRYLKVSLLHHAKEALAQEAGALRNALLQSDAAETGAELDRAQQSYAAAQQDLERVGGLLQLPQAVALSQAADAARARYQPARARLLELIHGGDKAGATALLFGALHPLQQAYQDAIDQLVAFQTQLMRDAGAQAQRRAHTSSQLMVALGVAGGLLSLLTGWLITRGIVGPINHAVRVARTVAGGDLGSHIEVRSRDEIGQLSAALKDMNQSLISIVGEVRGGTDTIAAASAEIAAGNLDLSTRTEQQAGSLEETASSLEQLTATVKQNAGHAHQANALARSASDVAGQGGAVVAQVVDTMSSIHASARQIVDIIAVIDGIAFQTNILALNAAVEAARAGEQGRGFAVVAGEVRSLAQRSAAAAHQIKDLISASVDKIETGARLVDQAGSTMGDIVASVGRVTDIMGDIAAASQEQLAGIEHVNAAMAQMDKGTQQNAALVEQAAAAAAAMQEQAAHLSAAVGVFKLRGDGGASRTASVTAMPHAHARPALRAIAAPSRMAPRRSVNGGAGDDWMEG